MTSPVASEHVATVDEPPAVGHIDWEAHNLDWDEGPPILVHDWDSLAIRAEASIAGAAATVFPCDGIRAMAATIDETAAFLDAYASARPAAWCTLRPHAWCSGLWVLTYSARKQTVGGGAGYLEHLEREHAARSARADI